MQLTRKEMQAGCSEVQDLVYVPCPESEVPHWDPSSGEANREKSALVVGTSMVGVGVFVPFSCHFQPKSKRVAHPHENEPK